MRHARRPAFVFLILFAGAACEPIPIEGGYGPLAVTDSDVHLVAAALGGAGALVIGDECVVLNTADGRTITLVFRAQQIEWNEMIREVRLKDPFLGPIVLANGASIEVGGAPIVLPGAVEPPTTVEWIAKPDGSCPRELFEVHTVKLTN